MSIITGSTAVLPVQNFVYGGTMRISLGLAATVTLGFCMAASAAQVTVGSGSSWSLGDSTVNWGCDDIVVDGTLNVQAAVTSNADSVAINGGGTVAGGSGTLGLTGDFLNTGTFSKGTGTVAIRDGCGNTSSTIAGNQDFRALSVITTTGKTLLFTAGATTSVSPGTLTLQGAAGNLLRIRSTAPGSAAFLALNGSQNISYVDVADNRGLAAVLAPGPASASNSVNSGNVLNWFDVLPIIPTLSTLGLLILAAAIALLGITRSRRRLTASSSAHA